LGAANLIGELMTFKQAAFLSLAGLAAIIAVPALIFGLMSLGESAPHPSDQYLEQMFLAHEGDFNRLVEMSNVDMHVVRIAPDFTWLDNNAGWPRPESQLGFSPQRWDEYRSLFAKLRLTSGILNYQPNLILFLASTKGLVTSGSMKGYAYSLKEPEVIVESLDNPSFSQSHIVYKRLKGNWYLFYEIS
jgi:hypothetical protein